MPSRPDTIQFFNELNIHRMDLVDSFYDKQAVFQDPLGTHVGREAIRKYYANLYKNVKEISFDFTKVIEQDNMQTVVWTMTLVSELRSGKPIKLDGASVIEFGGKENKAVFHRDYFDMGEFVYEGIPVLGGMIRFIKRKLKGN